MSVEDTIKILSHLILSKYNVKTTDEQSILNYLETGMLNNETYLDKLYSDNKNIVAFLMALIFEEENKLVYNGISYFGGQNNGEYIFYKYDDEHSLVKSNNFFEYLSLIQIEDKYFINSLNQDYQFYTQV